jgi:hypothetical protein
MPPSQPSQRPPRTSIHVVLILSLGWLACQPGEGEDTEAPTEVRVTGGVAEGERVTGPRTLQATARDDSGTVARVEFSVSGRPACADEVAKASGETFSCTWDSSTSPAGSHQLTARAHDAAGNDTRSEPVSFTIPLNTVPTISQASAASTSLNEGASTTLSVTASDPDGDPLTYVWTQSPVVPAGTFGSETGTTRTWTAPILSRDTSFTLRVTVSDGRGGSAQATVAVNVANVPALNRAPVVDENITAPSERVVAGDGINLSIGAIDLDGDPLTYSWTTSPPGLGTFRTSRDSVALWHSPDLSAATTYTLQVTVSDGAASVTRSVALPVQVPTYAADIQPLWSPTCTTCHSGGGGGRLNLESGSSYASIVNRNGTASCGTFPRVMPGQPDQSLLVLKISGDSCGGRMPQQDTGYFDRNPGELVRIRSWILAGALND